MKLLHIDAGITGPGSLSRQLSGAVVEALSKADPSIEVTRRDLEADPIGHLDGRGIGLRPVEGADDDAAKAAAVLQEFLDADVVVIGAPMYNFSIPSQLKAWIDRILVAGKTFRYSEAGPEGLAGAKTVIVASSRGGLFGADTPQAALDHQENYLRTVFGFIGVSDVKFVRAEGVAYGPAHREAALAAALAAAPVAVAGLRLAEAA